MARQARPYVQSVFNQLHADEQAGGTRPLIRKARVSKDVNRRPVLPTVVKLVIVVLGPLRPFFDEGHPGCGNLPTSPRMQKSFDLSAIVAYIMLCRVQNVKPSTLLRSV
jgi:hypothetical protein